MFSLSNGINFNLLVGAAQIISTSFYNYLDIRQIKQLRKKENMVPKLNKLGIKFKKDSLSKTYDYNLEKKRLKSNLIILQIICFADQTLLFSFWTSL